MERISGIGPARRRGTVNLTSHGLLPGRVTMRVCAEEGRVAGPVERTRYSITLDLSPDEVLRVLVDFGPDRPEVWRETSHPAVYRVHGVGDTHAEVTEGVPFAWSRERYDWSDPGVVTLTQLESNVARNGSIRYEIAADKTGSVVTCVRYREFRGLRGRLAGTLMVLFGARLLKAQFRAGCERWRRRHSARDDEVDLSDLRPTR